MNQELWLKQYEGRLNGKTVAITGATGGLGHEICEAVAALGGNLLCLTRDQHKTDAMLQSLQNRYPALQAGQLQVDLADIQSVKMCVEALKHRHIDVLMLNAGAYKIPRKTCSTGFDNVFQINFLSHYYMVKSLLPQLEAVNGRVVAVGSIAHTYSVADPDDSDFSGYPGCAKVYGNSKRYLMFALFELMKDRPNAGLSIVHPGIAVTNMTAHFPSWLYFFMKYPMKMIFMSRKKAARSLILGLLQDTGYLQWIGPRYFNIWGNPSVKQLHTCNLHERKQILESAEKMADSL